MSKPKMNQFEMVVATRIRASPIDINKYFFHITLPILCLIFKDSLIKMLEWGIEKLFKYFDESE